MLRLFYKETRKVRKFGDVFAFVNYRSYKEIRYFEKYLIKKIIDNVLTMSGDFVKNITNGHAVWAETTGSLKEINKIISNN